MSLFDAHGLRNMKQVDDIIQKCTDKSYALVSVYINQNT